MIRMPGAQSRRGDVGSYDRSFDRGERGDRGQGPELASPNFTRYPIPHYHDRDPADDGRPGQPGTLRRARFAQDALGKYINRAPWLTGGIGIVDRVPPRGGDYVLQVGVLRDGDDIRRQIPVSVDGFPVYVVTVGRVVAQGAIGDDPTDAPLFDGPDDPTAPLITFNAASQSPTPQGIARQKWARQAIIDGWAKVHPGYAPNLSELQATQAWSDVESGYGGWANHPKCGNNGVGSNNWGSVQKCKPCTTAGAYCCKNLDGLCPAGTFECGDYDAAHNKDYRVCFLQYPTPADGAAGIIKHMTTLRPLTWAAIKTGDAVAIATAMYDEHYYGGRGATREIRIEGGVKAITEHAAKIAAALGEPIAVCRGCGASGPPPTPGPDGTITPTQQATSSNAPLVLGVLAVAAVAGGIWYGRQRLRAPQESDDDATARQQSGSHRRR